VALLGQKINERAPGLYDYQQRLLLPLFYTYIGKLKESARFFYSALDISFNKDKGAFFAFLGSLEMPAVHKALQNETAPAAIMQKFPGIPETEMRQIALKAFEDALALITEENRYAMYTASRSLHCLRILSSFLFDRLIVAFSKNAQQQGPVCSVSIVRELLISLNNTLFSLKGVPPITLLESLFVFILQERVGVDGVDMDKEIEVLLKKAETSLAVIREFNRLVPLACIIRCAARDMSVSPKEISGGEDWFVVYRDYWRRSIETLCAEYGRERRRAELHNSFKRLLQGAPLVPLAYAKSEQSPQGIPVKGALVLSFLLAFYNEVFLPAINKTLKTVLLDGEFQKYENRVEFAESYSVLIKYRDDIGKFEQEIAPAGDYGKRYALAQQEMSAPSVKRRKVQLVLEDINDDSEKIISSLRAASTNMGAILGGLIGQSTNANYGVLSNLSNMAGKNSEFIAGIKEAIKLFLELTAILDGADTFEEGK
jgi:hypothetical protein